MIVGHHPDDLRTIPRPHMADLFYTAAEVAASLDPGGWDIVASEARPREEHDSAGQPVTIHDALLKARRKA